MSIFKKMLSNAKCKKWWDAALRRAWHAVWQAMLGVISGSTLLSEPNWALAGSAALMAGIASLVKSLAAGVPECSEETEVK